MAGTTNTEKHGPCSLCGRETTGGFASWGGTWVYRCETCPHPRPVRSHTPGWNYRPEGRHDA